MTTIPLTKDPKAATPELTDNNHAHMSFPSRNNSHKTDISHKPGAKSAKTK